VKHKPLLNEEERLVWRTFLQVHAGLTRRLDDQLRATLGISLNGFEVLWVLVQAHANKERMADLADHLVYTRSGVTRLVDRLERDGLVVRGDVDEDARGRYAILTRKGFELFEEGARMHVLMLRALFFARLDDGRLARLGTLLTRLEKALAEPS